MLTVLEGPDGAGKTTLARQVFGDQQYMHFGPPPKNPPNSAKFLHPAFAQYLASLAGPDLFGINAVIDRFIYGELIYGPIFRHDNSFERWMVRMLERIMLSYQGVVVFCMPPWDDCKRNWESRKGIEMIQEENTLRKVWEAYFNLASDKSRVSLPTYWYNYLWEAGADHPLNVRERIDAVRAPLNKGPGIGMFRPGVTLIVGEQVNTNVDLHGWPFVAGAGSSRWLTRILDSGGVLESELYWVNAKDRNGRFIRPDFLDTLQPGRIVTLGSTAREWVDSYDIYDRVALPHPAYWQRFYARHEYPIIDAIRNSPLRNEYAAPDRR